MNFQQSIKYLYSFVDFERTTSFTYDTRTLDLEAFLELLALLSSPQKDFDIVHVAGTKGKGSTCAMLASILKSSKLRAGLYTSPHLLDVRERIQVDGEWISEEAFASILSEIEPVQTRLGVRRRSYRTTFELLTATALCYFARRKVDVAVLETGLGGRLDSTNVVEPEVCVITRVGYDHTAVLGEQLGAIAAEKAGIIKSKTPVVIGPQLDEAHDVIVEMAQARAAPIVDVAADYRFSCEIGGDMRMSFSACGRGLQIDDVRLPLLGGHQAENACCAVAASQVLSRQWPSIDAESIRQGISQVQLMGRIEVIGRDPWVILDCAHNRESAEALVATLKSMFEPLKKIVIVGLSSNKDAESMLAILVRYFDKFIVTRADTKRAMAVERLCEILDGLGADIDVFERSDDAASAGLSMTCSGDLLCVTGSVYLGGELRPKLARERW